MYQLIVQNIYLFNLQSLASRHAYGPSEWLQPGGLGVGFKQRSLPRCKASTSSIYPPLSAKAGIEPPLVKNQTAAVRAALQIQYPVSSHAYGPSEWLDAGRARPNGFSRAGLVSVLNSVACLAAKPPYKATPNAWCRQSLHIQYPASSIKPPTPA